MRSLGIRQSNTLAPSLGMLGDPEAAVCQRVLSERKAEVLLVDTGRPRSRRRNASPPSARIQVPGLRVHKLARKALGHESEDLGGLPPACF